MPKNIEDINLTNVGIQKIKQQSSLSLIENKSKADLNAKKPIQK